MKGRHKPRQRPPPPEPIAPKEAPLLNERRKKKWANWKCTYGDIQVSFLTVFVLFCFLRQGHCPDEQML